jgi:hypothetical protein
LENARRRGGSAAALIDAIHVMPEDKGHVVKIVGELGALLQLGSNSKNAASIGGSGAFDKVGCGERI